VAAYPEVHPDAKGPENDIEFLKRKFDAGANSAITQYFYNVEAYFYFVEQCQKNGIDRPIYPGIMPITNYHNLARFSKTTLPKTFGRGGTRDSFLYNEPG
jgi:methylenetetrahydrofolate reductase (NADPH)